MQKLTKQAEQRLMTALDHVGELINSGASANAAIIKAAQHYGVPSGHVPIMVHAYNTGRTTVQRQTGDSAIEKAAEFPLADTDDVLAGLYPSAKAAADNFRKEYVPVFLTKAAPSQPMTKAAGLADGRAWRIADAVPRSQEFIAADAFRKSAAADKAWERHRGDIFAAEYRVTSCFGELGDLMKQADNRSRLAAENGLPLLHGELGEQLVKYAQLRNNCQPLTGETAVSIPTAIVKAATQCVAAVQAYVKLAQAEPVIFDEARAARAEFDTLIERPDTTDYGVLAGLVEKPAGLMGSAAGAGAAMGARDFLRSSLGSIPGISDDTPNRINRSVLALEDPTHEAELRKIRTQAMLSELMANDEVISSYDPRSVANAFTEIAQFSPRAADRSLIMRGLLRTRLTQGDLNPFETYELGRAESNLKQQDESGDSAIELLPTKAPAPR